jgi:hypothetical protein
MNDRQQHRRHPHGSRRGLAPLELVLWLPVFMLIAALMINLGTSTAWRIRGEIVARDAAWRVRWPRTGRDEPRPLEKVWPADAKMELAADDEIARLDDQAINHPVIRGPLPGRFVVRPLLDPDREGAYRGSAEMNRPQPLLKKMGKLGQFNSGEIKHPMLDGQWQTSQMNIENEAGERVGLPRNVYRRTKVLYELPKTDPGLPQAFVDAVVNFLEMPEFEALEVLNGFYPRVNARRCELDVEVVREREVERLIDTPQRRGLISRVPRTMERILDIQQQNAANGPN